MTLASDSTGPDGKTARQWDVALSYAGEQREYVGRVAGALKARGVRCFYDADEPVRLWGAHLTEELPQIYAQESAAVVVFISVDYVGKGWPRLEGRAAFTRAVMEAEVHVLPARFDDTELPGLLPDMPPIDLRRYTPEQFADLVVAKLTELRIIHPAPPDGSGGVEGRPPAEFRTEGHASTPGLSPASVATSTELWWENPGTDWTTGDAARLLSILSVTYPPQPAVMAIAGRAGFDPGQMPTAPDTRRNSWLWILNRAARENCVPDFLANVITDPSGAEAYPAVAWFLGEALAPVMTRHAATGEACHSLAEGLETITSIPPSLIPVDTHGQTINELKLRTAIIKIKGVPTGTGVLVGADLLLTTAHVIGAGNWRPTTPASIEAVFDFIRQPDSRMTGISTSILVDKVIGGSPSTDSEAAGNTREDQDTPFKYLDYALLRLSFPATKRPDGVPRGYYLLRSDAYESETSQEFHQAQYPLGGPIVLSPIANPPGLDKSKTRIRYTCNTSYGSSGGPMVDNQGRLVAIHQYAAGRTGRGVPISAIANHLLNTPHARLFDTVTTSGVTHLGHYSTSTRDEICSRIDVPWHVVASELNAPGSVVSPLDLWEWLRSSRKLYQLRSTFTRLGYLELAKILDRDLIDQSHARELSRLDEMSSLAGRLLNSVTRGQSATQLLDLAVRTHDVTGLAGRLRDALDALPAWHEDQRLQIGWRMDWSTEVTRAKKAIDKVSGIFPVSNSDESQGRRSVRVAMANAREAASAIAALSKLARKWPLVP